MVEYVREKEYRERLEQAIKDVRNSSSSLPNRERLLLLREAERRLPLRPHRKTAQIESMGGWTSRCSNCKRGMDDRETKYCSSCYLTLKKRHKVTVIFRNGDEMACLGVNVTINEGIPCLYAIRKIKDSIEEVEQLDPASVWKIIVKKDRRGR